MNRPTTQRSAAISCILVLLLLCWLGRPEGLIVLLTGWITYPCDILPRVTVSWGPTISAGVYFVAFTIGAHLLLRWLYRETGENEPSGPGRRGTWRWRWTLSGVFVVVLMFAAGTAAVGVVHQVAFLATSDQPAYSMPDYWKDADGKEILSACRRAWEASREPNWDKSVVYQDEMFQNMGYMPSESVRLIVVAAPNGHPSAIAVLHRDSARQAQYGVAVATAAGVRLVPPEQLPAILHAAEREVLPQTRSASGLSLP